MKSFRLDPDSVKDVLKGWPLMLILIIAGSLLAWLSVRYEWVRIFVPLVFGVAIGPTIGSQLRQKYPTATGLWLLTIGMTTCLIGVLARMAFPSWQGTGFDLSWLGITFCSILAFVIINAGNKDVVR